MLVGRIPVLFGGSISIINRGRIHDNAEKITTHCAATPAPSPKTTMDAARPACRLEWDLGSAAGQHLRAGLSMGGVVVADRPSASHPRDALGAPDQLSCHDW